MNLQRRGHAVARNTQATSLSKKSYAEIIHIVCARHVRIFRHRNSLEDTDSTSDRETHYLVIQK